ncbi:MAG: DoxX family protein [Chloroflexota bacterium]
MGIVLTILQGLVGLAFVASGAMKASQGKEKLAAMGDNMAWTEDFTGTQIQLIGVAEVLGGLALLITLFVTSSAAYLIGGIAGICLAILMGGAAYTHIRRSEMSSIAPNIVLGLLALVASYNLLV